MELLEFVGGVQVSAAASTTSNGTAFAFFDVLAIVPILSWSMPEACPRHASGGRVSARQGTSPTSTLRSKVLTACRGSFSTSVMTVASARSIHSPHTEERPRGPKDRLGIGRSLLFPRRSGRSPGPAIPTLCWCSSSLKGHAGGNDGTGPLHLCRHRRVLALRGRRLPTRAMTNPRSSSTIPASRPRSMPAWSPSRVRMIWP